MGNHARPDSTASDSAVRADGRKAASRDLPWVVVRVGHARLALPSGVVREMLELPRVTHVPGLPSDAAGVITWRGRVAPVVDLRARLELPPRATAAGRRMAVVVDVGGAGPQVLAVDGIDGVEGLEPGSVSPLPPGLEAQGSAVRQHGRLRRDGAVVLLLDVAQMLGGAVASAEAVAEDVVADNPPPPTSPDPEPGPTLLPEPVTLEQARPARKPRPVRKRSSAPRAPSSDKGSRSPRRRNVS